MDGTAEMGRRADDGPPEQDRAAEEREVLEVMEAAITERRLVGPREMPTPEEEGVRGPRYGSTRQGLPDPAHGRATHEEPPGPDASPRRQGPEERRERVGQEKRSEERRVGKECRSRWSPYH